MIDLKERKLREEALRKAKLESWPNPWKTKQAEEAQPQKHGLRIPFTIEKDYFEDFTPRNRAERRHGRKI
jgi:hypothetical protein